MDSIQNQLSTSIVFPIKNLSFLFLRNIIKLEKINLLYSVALWCGQRWWNIATVVKSNALWFQNPGNPYDKPKSKQKNQKSFIKIYVFRLDFHLISNNVNHFRCGDVIRVISKCRKLEWVSAALKHTKFRLKWKWIFKSVNKPIALQLLELSDKLNRFEAECRNEYRRGLIDMCISKLKRSGSISIETTVAVTIQTALKSHVSNRCSGESLNGIGWMRYDKCTEFD